MKIQRYTPTTVWDGLIAMCRDDDDGAWVKYADVVKMLEEEKELPDSEGHWFKYSKSLGRWIVYEVLKNEEFSDLEKGRWIKINAPEAGK